MSTETTRHVVAKAFNTSLRRFADGAPVAETDDLSPHSFADLKARGFILDTAQDEALPSAKRKK